MRILLPPITPAGKVKKPVKSRTTFAGTCRQNLRESVLAKVEGGFEGIYRRGGMGIPVNFSEVREKLGYNKSQLPDSRICSIFRIEGYRTCRKDSGENIVLILRDESEALKIDPLGLKAKKEETERNKKQEK